MPDLNRPSLAELIDLNDRRSVVTGAAKGIGLAIARRLTEALETLVAVTRAG